MAEEFKIIETQEQLNAIIADRLNRAKTQHDTEISTLNGQIQTLTAENTRLKGEAEQTANWGTELESLRQKVTTYETDSAKRDIAEAFGLPKGFYSRLRGTTPEELKADAAELAKVVTASQAIVPPLGSAEPSGEEDPTKAGLRNMIKNKGE